MAGKDNSFVAQYRRNPSYFMSGAAAAPFSVEPFFVPFEVFTALFRFAAHARVFASGFIYQVYQFLLGFWVET